MRFVTPLLLSLFLASCAALSGKSDEEQLQHDVEICAKSALPFLYQMGVEPTPYQLAMYCMEVLQSEQHEMLNREKIEEENKNDDDYIMI
jgi:hypothetical protein